ncbi:hypothetical protein ACIOUE_07175 [Streptomyces xanthochromogenes]|uniref:hypothetical protein n=1 Tax=Streptomyces xanthochromogenes TaxID=67384 RepID=UPI00341A0175
MAASITPQTDQRTRDYSAAHDTVAADLVRDLVDLVRTRLKIPLDTPCPLSQVVAALRGVEAASGGPYRDLIGHAAANLDGAAWVGYRSEEGRLRMAVALDYLSRAHPAEGDASRRDGLDVIG